MKKITQSLEYEGSNCSELSYALQRFHKQSPFNNGVDWQFQTLWATMTDEQHLMFSLKHPEFSAMFKDI